MPSNDTEKLTNIKAYIFRVERKHLLYLHNKYLRILLPHVAGRHLGDIQRVKKRFCETAKFAYACARRDVHICIHYMPKRKTWLLVYGRGGDY